MFAVAGETLVDVVHEADGARREHPGGSPANVALGLARLAHDVTLLTQVGRDAHGDLVAGHLADSGVRLGPGSVVDTRTSTATAHLDAAGRATYTFDLDWEPASLALPPGARVLHTGSLGTLLPPGARATAALAAEARAAGLLVSYDPNARPSLVEDRAAYRAAVESLVATSHVVKASDEDLTFLYPDVPAEAHPALLVDEWCGRLGATLAVVTRGPAGADAAHPSGAVHVPAPTVDVVDTVGAGDAFTAGLLDGLAAVDALDPASLARLDAAALTTALSRAVRTAALTVARPGADPPTRAALDEALAGR